MQARGLVAASMVLALLAGGVWFSNRQEAKNAAAPRPNAAPKVMSIPLAELREVIVDKGGQRVRAERGDGGAYTILEPSKAAAEQEAAIALFLQFSALEAERIVDEKPSNLAQFGLDPPRITVTAVGKKGPPVKILLGEMSPTGTGTYAKVESEPRVFTFSQMMAAGFDKTFNDIRDKRLIPYDRGTLARINVMGKGTAEITPGRSGWKLGNARADGSTVDQLLNALDQTRMNPQATPASQGVAAKAWATAAAVGTVRITDPAGARTIEVRQAKPVGKETKGAVYVKSSTIDGIHTGPAELADLLGKPTAAYRNMRLFDFGFDDPTRVEVKGGVLSRMLAQANGKWTEGGKPLDSVGAQSLVDKLRDLHASAIAPKASGPVELELVVISGGGQRTEHVSILNSAGSFYGLREGEPEYYALDKQIVNDLRQAAADVREAAKNTVKDKK